MKRILLFFVLSFTLSTFLKGQNFSDYNLYSYNYALYNPAAAGADQKHIVAAQGMLYTHEEIFANFNIPYSGLLTYEGNFAPINSGIGAMVIMTGNAFENTKKLGLSYNYNIKFAPSTSLRIGLRPTLSRYTIDYSEYNGVIVGDPTREDKESSSKEDLDMGLHLNTFGFYIAASYNNVFGRKNKASLDDNDHFSGQMFSMVAGRKFNLQVFAFEPSVAFTKQNNFSAFWVNTNMVLAKSFLLGATFTQSLNDSDHYNIAGNVGLSIAGKVDFIAHVYSRQMQKYRTEGYRYLEGMIRIKI